ncbi:MULTISPECIES: alanine racemase [Actinomycetes]|uniref:Alanine racemase n=2 Tax=Actinomycetes TaxID=1760 RepID=A0ABP6LWQ0_9MICC|nr:MULTISPECIES: alanine racemase [unclassified Nesterenkonia]MDS2172071.1 alanine racemase [Nesterenkonia sp. CL21]OSM43687.1 alanine racemase [Nesterenkonia sp. PF2B19]
MSTSPGTQSRVPASSRGLPEGCERAAIIDPAAIRHNVETIASYVRPAKVMVAVKADGYGHGAVTTARAAVEAGADWIGVAHVTEAIALRDAGIEAPVLAWLHTAQTDFAEAIERSVDVGISGWELDEVAAAASSLQTPANVHLKIDTGLGRNGCTVADWPQLVARAAEHQDRGLISVVGIFTHLAVADEPDRRETDEQLEVYREALQVAEEAGLSVSLRHVANTPAAFSRPDAHFDMVRVGVGVYGQSPFADRTAEELGLRPAMELRTTVANVKRVPAGQGISYGLTHRVDRPTALALIPLGYGDGVPRIAVHAPVQIAGRVYQSAGRVAMDQFVVDLEDPDTPVQVGDDVVLFGGDSGISAADWGRAAQTINYEIITRIGGRVPRLVVDSAELAAGHGSTSDAVSAPGAEEGRA